MKPVPNNANVSSNRHRKSLRGKTDKSLEFERSTTDKHLQKKRKAVEKKTTAHIIAGRESADLIRDTKRAKLDSAKKRHRRANGASLLAVVEDKILAVERIRSDEAQEAERESEDLLRIRERIQKRTISEALLDSERKDTDDHLRQERTRLDSDSRESTLTLDLTKSALVTRDQFLAVVSHDLKNPLSAISLSAGLLRRGLPSLPADTSRFLRHVETIERNAANMDRMITDLLDVERMANGKVVLRLEPVDLCELLRECVELFRPVIEQNNFRLILEIWETPIYSNVDRDRIMQVLSNLVGNALKFTPHGGTLLLSAAQVGKKVEICVTDNGPGIPLKRRREIFERFSQLNSQDRRGLGLGLFISKSIVEAHSGRIGVISTVGKGSKFRISLAITQP